MEKVRALLEKEGWVFLDGDLSFEVEGGVFYRKEHPVCIILEDKEYQAYSLLAFYSAEEYEEPPALGLLLCCPSAIPEEMWKKILAQREDEEEESLSHALCVAHSEGFSVPIKSKTIGESTEDAFCDAITSLSKDVFIMEVMPGLFLDRAINRIGTTGWELLRGDTLGDFYRAMCATQEEKK